MIFSRGDPARDIYLVLEGRIRLSILSSDGRELSFDHAGPATSSARSPPWMAATDRPAPRRSRGSRPWRFRSGSFRSSSRATRKSRPQRSVFCASDCAKPTRRWKAIALHRIEVRLARLMLSALRQQSPAAEGENVPLDLGMSQGELALLIGASRPKVNIALTALEDMGAITRTGVDIAVQHRGSGRHRRSWSDAAARLLAVRALLPAPSRSAASASSRDCAR